MGNFKNAVSNIHYVFMDGYQNSNLNEQKLVSMIFMLPKLNINCKFHEVILSTVCSEIYDPESPHLSLLRFNPFVRRSVRINFFII